MLVSGSLQLLEAPQQPPLAQGIHIKGLGQAFGALITSRIDAVIEHQDIETTQGAVELLLLAAAPANPFLRPGQAVLSFRLWSVTQSDNPGASLAQPACQCAAKLSARASDANSATLPGP